MTSFKFYIDPWFYSKECHKKYSKHPHTKKIIQTKIRLQNFLQVLHFLSASISILLKRDFKQRRSSLWCNDGSLIRGRKCGWERVASGKCATAVTMEKFLEGEKPKRRKKFFELTMTKFSHFLQLFLLELLFVTLPRIVSWAEVALAIFHLEFFHSLCNLNFTRHCSRIWWWRQSRMKNVQSEI